MKLFRSSLPRAAVLALVCTMTVSARAQAENPLTNISGRIKNGVSNVGTAIKKTAKAAKNIVTPGKAPEEKPAAPRPSSAAGASKKSSPATAGQSAKTKKTAATAPAAKPAPAPAPASASKPKAKPTTGSVPVSTSKTKPRAKTQSLASDSGDRPKSRKKATADSSRDEEESKPASTKKKRNAGDPAPEHEVAQTPEAPTPMSVAAAAGNVESAPAAGDAPQAEPLPFGTPAFGRKGFVYSPYAPDQGLIDVKSVAAGAKVRCPYTGKVFRVP